MSVGAWVHIDGPCVGRAVFRLAWQSSQLCSSHYKAVSLTLLLLHKLFFAAKKLLVCRTGGKLQSSSPPWPFRAVEIAGVMGIFPYTCFCKPQ